uniref:C-X-C chemokine receptor type 6 n=1 Tax=Sphenodon punctatus TaxID=8508 RepID=A0A8D0HC45_SPHPU
MIQGNNTETWDIDTDDYEFLNSKSADLHSYVRFSQIFLPCMYSFAFVLGLVGNSLVLIIYLFYEKMKTLTDVFLVSLAIADLLFLFTLPFWAYAAAYEWIFGTYMCKFIRGLYSLNLYTSMLTLTCMTIDRLIAITQATKAYQSKVKKTLWGKVICVLVWMISLAFALPQFMISMQSKLHKSVCHANNSSKHTELVIKVTQITLGYFIPMLTMIICYSRISLTLLRVRGFHKHKSLKIIFSVVAVFLLTQSPYNLLVLIRTIHRQFFLDNNFAFAVVVTEAIAYFRCCLNPVLYFFIGVKFRKHFQKIFKDTGCVKHLGRMKQLQSTEDEGSKSYTASNIEATSMYPL